MRVLRAFVILAVVAALWGAPSSVSAAANQLASPQVSPGSGTVATVFTFRVRYEGTFEATSVSVSVAGLTLPMVLEGGTLAAGWWTTASLLPVGAWSTTFRSTASRGPAGTADGPIVVVAAPFTPMPTASSASPPGQGGATPESAPVGDSGRGTAATAAPDAAPEEVTASSEPSSAPDAAPAAPATSPADAPAEPIAAPDARAGEGLPDAPTAGDNAPAASHAGTPSAGEGAARMRTERDSPASEAVASADALVSTLILVGLAGVASVAIVGTLLLLAGRRRDPEEATATPTAHVETATAPPRIARRTQVRPADDPIVAALGVDDEMAARRAIRRARTSRSAGAAPTDRPRRR